MLLANLRDDPGALIWLHAQWLTREQVISQDFFLLRGAGDSNVELHAKDVGLELASQCSFEDALHSQ